MALPTSLPTHGYMPCHEQHASGALRVCPSSAITPLPADLGHPSSQETKHECLVSHKEGSGRAMQALQLDSAPPGWEF